MSGPTDKPSVGATNYADISPCCDHLYFST